MSDASEVRAMLIEPATRLFADHVDARLLESAKRDGWSPELWRIVEAAQLPLVSIAEEAGGAGGDADGQSDGAISAELKAFRPVGRSAAAPAAFAQADLIIAIDPFTLEYSILGRKGR